MKCWCCESLETEVVKITVADRPPLAMQPWLCDEHMGRYMLRLGIVLGSLELTRDQVFSDAVARGDYSGPSGK